MDSFSITNEILENLKKKYKHMDNIYNLTKDMEKAFESQDGKSFEKILDMRGDAMFLVSKLDDENKQLIEKLPVHLAVKMKSMLFPQKTSGKTDTMQLANPLETNIYDTQKQIGQLIIKTVKLDTEISAKVNGTVRHGIDIQG